MGRFTDRVAIVTGSASGIGAATARRFAADGGAVVAVDVDGAGLATLAGAIEADGGRVVMVAADVSDPATADRMVSAAVDNFGRLDLLHSNAASGAMGRVGDLDLATWNRVLAVNLTAHFLGTRAALPVMIRQGGGVIINMSSAAALAAERGLGAYAAAKAGLIALTRNTAAEYGRYGIRANAICPGAIETPPTRAFLAMAEEMRGRMERANVLGRLGQADEVAALVCFLASDDAAFITGAVHVCDGGATADNSVGLLGD